MSSSTTWRHVEFVHYVGPVSTNASPPPPASRRKAVRVFHLCFLAGCIIAALIMEVML